MTTVTVKASQTYDVKIGRGLLDTLGEEAARALQGRTVCIVSETNVAPHYLSQATHSLERAGFTVLAFVFPAGEEHKNGHTYLSLLEYLAQEHLTRADGLVALGGGVVGDLTGFAAATYLRGIPVLQLPTTLLAAVDASVGGKTAIDLEHGKNLAGAFYQPKAVLCDLDTWATLPADILSDGCAEVIKYGMIGDADLLDTLAQGDFREDPEEVVARCIAHKRDLVEQDEFDTGSRQLLNLGHTIGHGIEAIKGIKGRRTVGLFHGECVALGMLPMIESKALQKRVRAIYRRLGLPLRTTYNKEKVLAEMLHDKKAQGGQITIIKVPGLGCWRAETIPVEGLRPLLGMEE